MTSHNITPVLDQGTSPVAASGVVRNGNPADCQVEDAGDEELTYEPIPPQATVTVSVRYRTRGRGRPLPYPVDEGDGE